jgi:Domain of unknown function (DUF4160)
MVVVHRAHGFRFVIYTSDHQPAHVHVVGAGAAKIDLLGPNQRPRVVWSVGMSHADVRRALAEVADRRLELLTAWKRIHG